MLVGGKKNINFIYADRSPWLSTGSGWRRLWKNYFFAA
jgi:hypothetical protein